MATTQAASTQGAAMVTGRRQLLRAARGPVWCAAGARRAAFYSLNGGSGRTTLAAEVAAMLAARGMYRPAPDEPAQRLRVALLDLDLRSPNVAMRLGVPHPTILDYLLAADDDGATVHPF